MRVRVVRVVRVVTRVLVVVACAAAGWLAGLVFRAQVGVKVVALPRIEVEEGSGMVVTVRASGGTEVLRNSRGEGGAANGSSGPDGEPGGSGGSRLEPRGGQRDVPVLRIFGDYECPACAELESRLGERLRDLARHGRLRLVYHHSPLSAHPRGVDAAQAAYCALELDPRTGWRVHGELYRRAVHWGNARMDGSDPVGRILAVAAAAGADPWELRRCMGGAGIRNRVETDRALARGLGVRAVPTVILDGARLEFGSWPALYRHVARRARPLT